MSIGHRPRSLGSKLWKSFFVHIVGKSRLIYVKPRTKW